MKNRIRSFTVMELIIVMLLFGIITSGVNYMILGNDSIIKKHVNDQMLFRELNFFYLAIQRDIINSKSIKINNESIEIKYSIQGKIDWIIKKDVTIRRYKSKIDSFYVSIEHPDFVQSDNNGFTVFTCRETSFNIPLTVIKYSDNCDFINQKIFSNVY